MKNTLGKVIKEERKKMGLSQREFGEISGINYSTIAKLETGERETTNVDILLKIADTIDMDLVKLLRLSNINIIENDKEEDYSKYDEKRRKEIAQILEYYKNGVIDIDTAINEFI